MLNSNHYLTDGDHENQNLTDVDDHRPLAEDNIHDLTLTGHDNFVETVVAINHILAHYDNNHHPY